MALRSGYKGFKKLLPGLKIIRPGTLGIDNDILIPELNKTFLPRSEQAIVGAVNLMPGNIYELNTASAEVGDSTFTTYAGVQSFIAPIKRNTTYTLSRAAGNRFRVALSNSFPANGVDCKVLINANINKYTFNSGDYDYVFVMLNAGSETYDNIKPVLNVGSVASSFIPYAMTNRELTPTILKATTDFTFDTDGNLLTKQGDIVVPYLRVTGVTATANDMDTPVCVVPEECRSQMTKIFPVISSGQLIIATLYTNGKIVVNTSVTSATITIMIPWSILP